MSTVPEDQAADHGMEEVGTVKLYLNSEGHLVNEMGERDDPLGRPTRARGDKGRYSSTGKWNQWAKKW